MSIEELQRRKAFFKENYDQLAPYERDNSISINKKLLELLLEAKHNRRNNGPTFMQLIAQMPVSSKSATTDITLDMCILELQAQSKFCKKRLRAKINAKLLSILSGVRATK